MKNIMITGGAGFIGSHVVRLFVTKYPQDRIINVDALTYAGNLENLRDIELSPNYTFEKVNNVKVPHRIGDRRVGDAEQNYADVTKANNELGWKAELNLEDMVRDAWRWQQALAGKATV